MTRKGYAPTGTDQEDYVPSPRATPASRAPGSPGGAVRARWENRRLLVVWLMVLSTLAVLPGGFSRFVLAKLLVVAVACLVAATLPAQGRLPRSVVWSLAAGLVVFVAASLAGDTPTASLVGRWPRYEGLPVVALYAGSAWVGARVAGRGHARAVQLVHALGAMSLVLFACTVLDTLGHSPLGATTLDRSGSLLGNATDQGLVAMVGAVVVAAVLPSRRTPYLLLVLVASLGTVVLSGSRIAIVLTAVSLVVLALVRHRRYLPHAGAAVAAVALATVLVPETRDRLLSGTTGRARLTQWDLTLDLVRDHPLLGVGPSGYLDAFGPYEDARWVRFTGPGTLADSPHDVLLQVLVAGGLPLLLATGVLCWCVLRRARTVLSSHPEAWGPAIAVGAYAVALLANFTSAGPTCLVAFLAGALVAEPDAGPAEDPGPAPSPWRRTGRVLVAAVAVVVVAMACVGEVQLRAGIDAARRGDVDSATAHLDSASSWRPGDGDVAMLGAQPLAALANTGVTDAVDPSERLSRQSLDVTPDTYAALLSLAVAQIAAGDLAGAVSVLDRAVDHYPFRADLLVQRGIARFGLGDRAGALVDLRRAVSLAPDSRVARRVLRQLRSAP